MTDPRLPARLRGVLPLIPSAARRVADVGAGHGALSVHLLGRADVVIATEAPPGAYLELCANLARWHAAPPVEARRGDGLDPLAVGEVDAVVVAGMGAHRALGIAARAAEKRVRWLILQCMQRSHLVEPWVGRQGWAICRRSDVTDRGRVYATWLVEVA